jgi:hypothetical protein
LNDESRENRWEKKSQCNQRPGHLRLTRSDALGDCTAAHENSENSSQNQRQKNDRMGARPYQGRYGQAAVAQEDVGQNFPCFAHSR